MQAHKVEAVLSENGTLVLEGLPFQAGEAVEVIILKKSVSSSQQHGAVNSLQNSLYYYDEPFELATALEDWEVLR
ncbi:hypothetical protein [Alkalinema sp. FACHB-956]|uniref:hypothetical protein n=1 Tax=Alkalinema sp. FACHB-956 TaxID=2692768 RepID=UPI00168203A3|nr:hypothetical protein [Alkalinema sp. FACHB-956]MBD2329690.1 hypothetical protein [Alkalinema sp. FACHB-956]